jgi:hypothetical protein
MTASANCVACVTGVAVTATMCRLVPIGTVWRSPPSSLVPTFGSNTLSVALPGLRNASHTVTDVGVVLRNTGPANIRGLLSSVALSDCQAMIEPSCRPLSSFLFQCGRRHRQHRHRNPHGKGDMAANCFFMTPGG